MRKILALIFLAGAGLVLNSCGSEPLEQQSDKRLSVLVSVLPQAYLVERIGAEHVTAEVLVGPGQNPHTFEPTAKQLARLENVRIYFQAGVPFEDTLLPKLRAGRPDLRIVDTRRDIKVLLPPEHDHDHEHQGQMDPHVWLDPKLAKVQAGTICDELGRADPDNQQEYRRNLKDLQKDLDKLDDKISAALKPLKGRTFYVFHPAFGYFARAYGLKQKAVEVSGKSPTAKQIAELIDQAKADGVRVIFVQPQFSQRASQAIAEQIDGAVVPLDPLGRDYVGNLQNMAEQITKALTVEGN